MDDQKKGKEDSRFVSCKEQHELDDIKKELKAKYPELKDTDIDEVLEHCCREIPPLRPRYKYMECLEEKLKLNPEIVADRIIKKMMYWSMGIGLVPFPVFDLAALLAIQFKMARDISEVYGKEFKEHKVASIILSIFGQFNFFTLAKIAGRSWFKLVPGIGGLLATASFSLFAGAATYAIGKVLVIHFELDGTLLKFDTKKMKAFLREQYERGMEEAKQIQEEKAQKQKA